MSSARRLLLFGSSKRQLIAVLYLIVVTGFFASGSHVAVVKDIRNNEFDEMLNVVEAYAFYMFVFALLLLLVLLFSTGLHYLRSGGNHGEWKRWIDGFPNHRQAILGPKVLGRIDQESFSPDALIDLLKQIGSSKFQSPPIWHHDSFWLRGNETQEKSLSCSTSHLPAYVACIMATLLARSEFLVSLEAPNFRGRTPMPWRVHILYFHPDIPNEVRWQGLVTASVVAGTVVIRWNGKLLPMLSAGYRDSNLGRGRFWFKGNRRFAVDTVDQGEMKTIVTGLVITTIGWFLIPLTALLIVGKVFYRVFRARFDAFPSLQSRYGWTGEWNWVSQYDQLPAEFVQLQSTLNKTLFDCVERASDLVHRVNLDCYEDSGSETVMRTNKRTTRLEL